MTAMATMAAEKEQVIVSHGRRLSADSDLSSYSVISGAPTVHSLDSNGDVEGGVIVTPTGDEELECTFMDLSILDENVSDRTKVATASDLTLSKNELAKCNPDSSQPLSSSSVVSSFWLQFKDFTPNPTATFKTEFNRLAQEQNWTSEARYERLPQTLTAEIDFHYGSCLNKLDRWQKLCEDVGVEDIPTSITQCRKALRPVMVSLHDVINHCRNPEYKVIQFRSYGAFCRHIRAGRRFPRECAKRDGFMAALLMKI
ncbi:hypothetical protein EK21DRAFT_104951 [Setomelanomma holmii]|uniref:Uncharacterized protein n=1 Tax=Setomelanomma holmii TaxID=210430 RepID=A0A9P4GW43_9PLEO|nr:hypothetical protein EK21DRAFT_104951 [Setomelanomma holmii]